MCEIIFEDNHLLVAVKPQNVPVVLDDSKDRDFLSELKNYLIKKHDKKGDAFLALVHRLDRPTGGVMVFAKTSKSAARLSEQLSNRTFEKTYFAVLKGVPRHKQNRLTNFLKKDAKNNLVKICTQYEDGAKEAILDYQVLDSTHDFSLVKVSLITGRSHQIRVQFAGIGCPVCFDAKYGIEHQFNNKKNSKTTQRFSEKSEKGNLALWSTQMNFNHPTTLQRMTFKVIPPIDQNPWNKFNVEKHF